MDALTKLSRRQSLQGFAIHSRDMERTRSAGADHHGGSFERLESVIGLEGSQAGAEELKLTDRDYYLLGSLVEGLRCSGGSHHHVGKLPRGCTDAQAERLVQAGYLRRAVVHPNSGKQTVRYYADEKGIAAWHANQFKGS